MKRRHVLASIKNLKFHGNGRRKSWFRNGEWCEPRQSVLNPCGEALSPRTGELLAKGPKCCLNLKPPRIDVLGSIHTVARIVNLEEKIAFVDHAISRVEKLMDETYPKDKINYREVNAVKREMQSKSLKFLETGKSERFAV